MTDELVQYNTMYTKYFSTPLDKPFYAKWLRSCPNPVARSPSTFENYIINSSEYRNYLYTRFKVLYNRIIGQSEEAVEPFSEFMKEYGGQVGRILDDAVIRTYIKNIPVFSRKYEAVIRNLYTMVNKEDIPENLLQIYLKNFISSDNYDIDALNTDIVSGTTPTAISGTTNIIHEIKTSWMDIYGCDPTSSEINELLAQLGNPRHILQSLIKQFNLFRNVRIDTIQQKFLEEFGREISAPELMKIYASSTQLSYEDLHEQHRQHFNSVKALYSDYSACDITEIDYIKRYIYVVDDPDYIETITRELVASKAYEAQMKALIQTVYTNLFMTKIEADDEQYMFEQIQSDAVCLTSPVVTETVTLLKKETDGYIENLTANYKHILKREPDVLECQMYKELYRNDHDMLKTEAAIKEALYTSLEYHEILKQKIKGLFKKTLGKDPLPSQVYALLNQALKQDIIRDDAALEALIKSVI